MEPKELGGLPAPEVLNAISATGAVGRLELVADIGKAR
jgi:hypothetical protein